MDLAWSAWSLDESELSVGHTTGGWTGNEEEGVDRCLVGVSRPCMKMQGVGIQMAAEDSLRTEASAELSMSAGCIVTRWWYPGANATRPAEDARWCPLLDCTESPTSQHRTRREEGERDLSSRGRRARQKVRRSRRGGCGLQFENAQPRRAEQSRAAHKDRVLGPP